MKPIIFSIILLLPITSYGLEVQNKSSQTNSFHRQNEITIPIQASFLKKDIIVNKKGLTADKIKPQNLSVFGDYALFEPTDLLLTASESIKNIKSKEEAADTILKNYYLFMDFSSNTKGKKPRDWFEKNISPQEKLIQGTVPNVNLPAISLDFPIHLLSKIPYIEGDGIFISRLNSFIDNWAHGRYQDAYNLIIKLKDEINGIKPEGLDALKVHALLGFFHFEVAAYMGTISITEPTGSKEEKLKPHEHYSRGRSYFWNFLNNFQKSKKMLLSKNTVDPVFYKSLQSLLVYFQGTRPNRFIKHFGISKNKLSAIRISATITEQTKAILHRTKENKTIRKTGGFEHFTIEDIGDDNGKQVLLSSLQKTDRLLSFALSEDLWLRSIAVAIFLNVLSTSSDRFYWERAFQAGEELVTYLNEIELPDIQESTALITQSSELEKVFVNNDRNKDESHSFFNGSADSHEQPDHVVKKELTYGLEDYNFSKKIINLMPKRKNDIIAVVSLFKANTIMGQNDVYSALEHQRDAIEIADDYGLKSLAFYLNANNYYSLGVLRLAKRSYSWAEILSEHFTESVPSSLFFGGESAFWQGDYQIAKKSMEKFLQFRGDKVLSPWAFLRLGEIEQKKGEPANARVFYERIVRNFPMHPASNDAQVRLFCFYVKTLPYRARNVEYQRVLEKIQGDARKDLKEEAKTCLLQGRLDNLKIDSEKNSNVVYEAEKQSAEISKFKTEFPDSSFFQLFSERFEMLKLRDFITYQETQNCTKFIDFYKKNRKNLTLLEKNPNLYVSGLKWDLKNKDILLRCAAYIQDTHLWQELNHLNFEKETIPLRKLLLTLSTKPSVYDALEIYEKIKPSMFEDLPSLVKEQESHGTHIVEKPDFWTTLALFRLLSYDLSVKTDSKKLFYETLAKDFIKQPKLILQNNRFCYWVLGQKNTFTQTDWDLLVAEQDTESWLKTLNSNKKSCQTKLSEALLNSALSSPSSIKDARILLPYLKEKGIKNASDDWLSYGYRLSETYGRENKEVQRIFTSLSQESEDTTIKKIATDWLKRNKPTFSEKFWEN